MCSGLWALDSQPDLMGYRMHVHTKPAKPGNLNIRSVENAGRDISVMANLDRNSINTSSHEPGLSIPYG